MWAEEERGGTTSVRQTRARLGVPSQEARRQRVRPFKGAKKDCSSWFPHRVKYWDACDRIRLRNPLPSIAIVSHGMAIAVARDRIKYCRPDDRPRPAAAGPAALGVNGDYSFPLPSFSSRFEFSIERCINAPLASEDY